LLVDGVFGVVVVVGDASLDGVDLKEAPKHWVVLPCTHFDDGLEAGEELDGSGVTAEPGVVHAARSGVGCAAGDDVECLRMLEIGSHICLLVNGSILLAAPPDSIGEVATGVNRADRLEQRPLGIRSLDHQQIPGHRVNSQ